MKLFQWIVAPLLVTLVVRELFRLRSRAWRAISFIRLAVWTMAMVLVVNPDLTVPAARLLGIERGVDLVVYLFILGSITISLYLYSRQDRLERKLVHLVRERALSETRRGGDGVSPSSIQGTSP